MEYVNVELVLDGSSGSPRLEANMAHLMQEVFNLWKAKQKSYGPHNISTFGLKGVVVRLWDKMQRIVRLTWLEMDNPLQNETIRDTLLDIADYGLIATLVYDGKWPKSEVAIETIGDSDATTDRSKYSYDSLLLRKVK